MTKVTCACGREIASRNFRVHARKCFDQLCYWQKMGNSVFLLDERSEAEKLARPIHDDGLST